MDGQPVIIVSDLLLEREKNLVKNHRWQTAANTQVKPYQKLEWEISERTRNDINEAVSVVEKEISKAHLSVMCLPGSGRYKLVTLSESRRKEALEIVQDIS